MTGEIVEHGKSWIGSWLQLKAKFDLAFCKIQPEF